MIFIYTQFVVVSLVASGRGNRHIGREWKYRLLFDTVLSIMTFVHERKRGTPYVYSYPADT